jgi:protein-disulfide isomerase
MKVTALTTLFFLLAACGQPSTNSDAPAGPVAAIAPPSGTTWEATVAETPDGGFRMGNPNAPIKLVEYGSRTCPICGVFGREGMKPLEEKYVATGKVAFEFREYLVHGQPDVPAALLGRCAGPGPFFRILEAMYQEQAPIEGKMGSAEGQALFRRMQGQPGTTIAAEWANFLGYVDFVKQRGIPEERARACLADGKALDRIVQLMNRASTELGVSGTPTFFINGLRVEGVTGWSALQEQLRAAGA